MPMGTQYGQRRVQGSPCPFAFLVGARNPDWIFPKVGFAWFPGEGGLVGVGMMEVGQAPSFS